MVFLFDWFFVGFGFGGGGGIKQKTVSMQMYAMILLAWMEETLDQLVMVCSDEVGRIGVLVLVVGFFWQVV